MSALGTLVGGIIRYVTPGRLGETLANNISDPTKDLYGNSRWQAVAPDTTPNQGNPQPTGFDSGATKYGSTGTGVSSALVNQSVANIQSAIDRLGGQQDVGNRNIDTSYNSALNNLNQAKADNQKAYDANKVQGQQDYVSAKNSIGTNTGNALTSLLRLLGARGAGGSSAALINAPQAAARQGTLQRTEAGNTFAKNMQNLDTGWNQYLQGFNRDINNLDTQRADKRNALQAQIDTTRASLLQSLAQLTGGGTAAQGYLDQANNLLSQADQLGAQTPVFQVAPTTYTAPSLSSYTTNPAAAPIAANSAATDYSSPFLSLLLNKKDNNPLGA